MDVDVTLEELPPLRLVTRSLVAQGTLLRLKSSGVSMLFTLKVRGLRVDGEELEIVHRFSREEMGRDWMWHIRTLSLLVARTARPMPAGSTVTVEAVCARDDPSERYAGLEWAAVLGSVEDTRSVELEPVADPACYRFVAGPSVRVEGYLKPDLRLEIQCFDSFGNPASSGRCRVERTAAREDTRVEVLDSWGRLSTTNARPISLDGTPIWFGECHWHCDFSGDGQRALAEALTSARDELHLDFAGPADHMSANGRYSRHGVPEQAALCRSSDVPGRFCTIPGAELSRRYGHANLYTDSFELLEQIAATMPARLAPAWEHAPDRYGLAELIALCPPGRSLVVPHHSNMDSWVREKVVREDGRPFWCAMHFPLPADRSVLRLFEMVQTRGAFEREETDAAWRITDGGLGGSARTALLRGYRLGFVGGTDNHCGWPTRSGSGTCGLTAVQGATLDRATIFRGLHDRRCYATTGARIVADATMNGKPMGGELRQEPGAPRMIRISIRGTAPIAAVEIVHAGYVLARLSVPPDALDFAAEWADERPGRPVEDAWYYVRARQVDGHCVWLSPFWIDLP